MEQLLKFEVVVVVDVDVVVVVVVDVVVVVVVVVVVSPICRYMFFFKYGDFPLKHDFLGKKIQLPKSTIHYDKLIYHRKLDGWKMNISSYK